LYPIRTDTLVIIDEFIIGHIVYQTPPVVKSVAII